MSYQHLMGPRWFGEIKGNRAPLYTDANLAAFERTASDQEKARAFFLVVLWLRVGWNARDAHGRIR